MAPPAPPQSEIWTTRTLLAWITSHLEGQGIHNPQLVSRMLLSSVLGGTDIELYTDPDRPASPEDRAALRELVARAANHEPVQYLVGRADFFGRSFKVDRSTLIPRTATETLIQLVLDHARGRAAIEEAGSPLRLADLGTGSGCIAITLARQLPDSTLLATDIVPEALALASANAMDQQVGDQIEFRLGSGLEPLQGESSFDVVAANLPYIPDGDWESLDQNVRDHEPQTALRGGQDGLDVIRPVLKGVTPHLVEGGMLVMEIDPGQGEEVLHLAREEAGLIKCEILPDEFGDRRLLRAFRS